MTPSSESGRSVTFRDPQVNLYVADIERSLRFYRDVLGFREKFRTPKEGVPSHVELGIGSLTLGLATFEALRRDHGISTGPGPPRGEIALATSDVDGAFGWSTSQGAPSLRPPADFGGYLRDARVADPDGNPIVFFAPLPVKVAANPRVVPTLTNHLVNILTNDLERSLGFYRDLLGFSETFRTPKTGPPEHVELELGALNVGVSTLEALERHHGLTGGGGPPRAEIALWASDVDGASAWIKKKGAASLSEPHDFAGVLRAAWVADPDGNPVQIVMRRPTR
jgi:catechol 2,3-dioxygenase-like lactoylglutathione lyase family enzyme